MIGVRVILLDIEGTTTPIGFVHGTLFSYARANLDRFLASRWPSPVVQDAASRLVGEYRTDSGASDLPPWRDDTADARRSSVSAYAHWLMDRRRKAPGLKLLQGLMWDEGYRAGALRGETYEDVPRAMARWQRSGFAAAVYSSGGGLGAGRAVASP